MTFYNYIYIYIYIYINERKFNLHLLSQILLTSSDSLLQNVKKSQKIVIQGHIYIYIYTNRNITPHKKKTPPTAAGGTRESDHG